MTKISSQFLFEKGPCARSHFPLCMYWEERCMVVQTLSVHCCSSTAPQGRASAPWEHRTTLSSWPKSNACSAILPPQTFLCGRARYCGQLWVCSGQTDWLCSELLHPCTMAICPSGVSCTPRSLEKHLGTFQSTSIPKHIFSLLSRYWQACHALLGQWLIATKKKGW